MLFAGLGSVRMVKTCSFQIVTDRDRRQKTLALNFGHYKKCFSNAY